MTTQSQPPGKMAFMLGMAAQVRARETVDGYVETYMRRNPAAHKALEAVVMQLTERSDHLRFDHLGFVAFGGVDGPGYKPIADVFTGLGWQERDTFELENGLVTARWYQPPSVDFPMVVVRELRVDRFGEECVEVCDKFVDDANNAGEETTRAAALTGGTPWRIEPGEDDLEVLGYYSPLLAWHLSHGYAAHAVAASVTGLAKSRSSGLAKSGKRAETHWHVAGANATVEDVRAVLERHGARMEDPAVVMSSDGSMRRVSTRGEGDCPWGRSGWGGVQFVRRLDGDIVTAGTGIDAKTQLREAFGFDGDEENVEGTDGDEDDVEGTDEEEDDDDGDPEGRMMLEQLKLLEEDSDLDDPLLTDA